MIHHRRTSKLFRRGLLALALAGASLTGCSSVPAGGLKFDKFDQLLQKPSEGKVAAARLLERRKDYAGARVAYLAILKDEPKNVEVLHRLAIVAAKEGKFAEAETKFKEAAEAGEVTAELANDQAYLLFLQDRLPEAEAGFRRAAEISPNYQPAWTNLGLTLGQLARYDEALAAFQKGANSPAEAHCSLAFVYAQAFELEKAQAQYRQALTLEPELKMAAEGLLQVSTMIPGSEPRTIVTTTAAPAPPQETESHATTFGSTHGYPNASPPNTLETANLPSGANE